jgi:hypothetical protein
MQRFLALTVILFSLLPPVFAAPPYQRPAGIADDKEPLIAAGYRLKPPYAAAYYKGMSRM